MKNYTLSLDVLKFGNFSKADSESGDGYFKHSDANSMSLQTDYASSCLCFFRSIHCYEKSKREDLTWSVCTPRIRLHFIFMPLSAQWRYKEQSLVSNVHKHKLTLLSSELWSLESRMGHHWSHSRRLGCQWCHLWADIPIMAWSMSHPPLSVIMESWAGELFVFLPRSSQRYWPLRQPKHKSGGTL